MSSSTWLCPPANPCTPPWFAVGCVWNKCINIYPRTQKVAAVYLCWLSFKLTKPLPLLYCFHLSNLNPCLKLNKANLAIFPPCTPPYPSGLVEKIFWDIQECYLWYNTISSHKREGIWWVTVNMSGVVVRKRLCTGSLRMSHLDWVTLGPLWMDLLNFDRNSVVYGLSQYPWVSM